MTRHLSSREGQGREGWGGGEGMGRGVGRGARRGSEGMTTCIRRFSIHIRLHDRKTERFFLAAL